MRSRKIPKWCNISAKFQKIKHKVGKKKKKKGREAFKQWDHQIVRLKTIKRRTMPSAVEVKSRRPERM